MDLITKKRQEIINDGHYRELNKQLVGEKTKNYDPLLDGQRNLDSDVYKNRALNYNISGKQLFKDENNLLSIDPGINSERQKMANEIKNSKTHRSEKTRKSRMADAAKAAKQAGIFKSNAEESLNSMNPFKIYQANTRINLSHYEMQENYAKAMAKSQDEEDLLIENAKRAFLIKEIGDILEAKNQIIKKKEKEKIDSSLKKALKEYTKILIKEGELKKEDAILYELNPQLIFDEIGVKKELTKSPDAADDMGVELNDYIQRMDFLTLEGMNDEEVRNNFYYIQKMYLYAKHARENAMQVDDEINTSKQGKTIKLKFNFLENLYRRAVFVKFDTKKSNKNYKEALNELKYQAKKNGNIVRRITEKKIEINDQDGMPHGEEAEKILKKHAKNMVDSSIEEQENMLQKEIEVSPEKLEEFKNEHYNHIMRFNLDSYVHLSDEDILLKYDELKRLSALGRICGADSLNNTEFDNYKYKRENIRVRMEVVDALCARASLLLSGKTAEDEDVLATRIKLKKLSKRYSIYKREFYRGILKDVEIEDIEQYTPDSELKVPKDILYVETKYRGKDINDLKKEFAEMKEKGVDSNELDLLQYAIFQKTGHYHFAGGVKKDEGFENDYVIGEAIFRAGIHQLFRLPIFKDMDEDEIRKFAFDISAGINLPTFDEVNDMEIADDKKETLRKEIEEAREKNISAMKTLVEKSEAYFKYVASIFGSDIISTEFLVMHKKDFCSFGSMTQPLARLIRDNEFIRNLIGKENGEHIVKIADFGYIQIRRITSLYTAKNGYDFVEQVDELDSDFISENNRFIFDESVYQEGLKAILNK